MARTDTLGNFLTDVADAIRTKKGTSETIQASDFDNEIANLPSGGGPATTDWNEIGYTSPPNDVATAVDYSKTIMNGFIPAQNLSNKYKQDRTIKYMPLVDTSIATNMSSMFYQCTNLTAVPSLNTSNVTSMGNMFNGCTILQEVNLFDTSNVEDMNNMFNSCTKLTTVPQFNTSSVTNMNNMFNSCVNLTTVPQFNTSSVTNMQNMFNACSKLTTIPQLNTSSVTTLRGFCSGCSALTTMPQLNTSSITGQYAMQSLVAYCTRLTDESLNNILAMCINATGYTGTKKLTYVGVTDATLKAKVPNLSNYQDFLNAGWTID